ncbi:hypothetical protein [Lancefieldella rimae]|uniref:hypothetical protein n=1 Tax=Lancefieldella rimae TaxID=1383 RepID=UPI0028EED3A4|nr:hypothetical protein [Lancefieldella rimae]
MSWHKGLFDNGDVNALDMSVNYRSQKFTGKLEALCGASYDEMLDDYMISYDNYYGINKEKDKARMMPW